MARITSLRIEGYRSIGDPVEIRIPRNKPVVLVGENNAGKSNIVKGLQLVLGPFWPGSQEPEDHWFHSRNPDQLIEIEVDFDAWDPLGGRYTQLVWRYDREQDEPVFFRGRPGPHGHGDGFVRNEDRDTCICVVVEAERNLAYHLSYSSKWTLLSRLMHRFHRALSGNEAVRQNLETLFQQVKERFHEVPEFRTFVTDLKAQFDDLVATMPHRLEIDFEAYNPVNFFHALRLHAAEADQPRTLEEMGTGEQQVLALAFAHAYARAFHGGILLVVEEPEAHLHPLAQAWLARRLRGQCADGLQLLITTHSPAFLDMESLSGLVLVRKEGGSTTVRQLTAEDLVERCVGMGVPAGRATETNILPFYAANATTELLSGFFARALMLVEGPTEALSLPEYLRKVGMDVEREGIAVLSVGGKGNLAKWYRLYKSYDFPVYIMFDNDASDDTAGEKRSDVLNALSVLASDHERLCGTADWIIEDQLAVCGGNFEAALRQHFGTYADLEAEAREQGIQSKPFIARWVAQRLDPNSGDEGWERIRGLATRIGSLIADASSEAASSDNEESTGVP